MTTRQRLLPAFLAALALLAAPPLAPTATAGCGCDHPPPAYALVMHDTLWFEYTGPMTGG